MENHPIPQDVTGFQFKLIGNMTIKQFAYLASGAVFAWLFFVSPLTEIIKIPFAFICGFLSFSLAFLPVDGRPMDSMLIYFFKALFSPNQYVYQRGQPENVILVRSPQATASRIQNDSGIVPLSADLPRITKVETAPESEPTVEIQPKEPVQSQTEYKTLLFQLSQTQKENERLAQELEILRQSFLSQTQQQTFPTIEPQPQPEPQVQQVQETPQAATSPIVKKVAAVAVPQAGVPMPTEPNVLVGIVKDPRGNVLPNILLEVKDKDGNPVRAFKTNMLGQFASATSLVSGVYTLEFDDPEGKQKFDALELIMQGEIIGPVQAISIDQREELRRALFQTT